MNKPYPDKDVCELDKRDLADYRPRAVAVLLAIMAITQKLREDNAAKATPVAVTGETLSAAKDSAAQETWQSAGDLLTRTASLLPNADFRKKFATFLGEYEKPNP